MEMENIILNEVSQVQEAKGCIFFSHIWNIDSRQIQAYYEMYVTQREGHKPESKCKKC
jgi:hypothetical protein